MADFTFLPAHERNVSENTLEEGLNADEYTVASAQEETSFDVNSAAKIFLTKTPPPFSPASASPSPSPDPDAAEPRPTRWHIFKTTLRAELSLKKFLYWMIYFSIVMFLAGKIADLVVQPLIAKVCAAPPQPAWQQHPWQLHEWQKQPWQQHEWQTQPWQLYEWQKHPWQQHEWQTQPWQQCPGQETPQSPC